MGNQTNRGNLTMSKKNRNAEEIRRLMEQKGVTVTDMAYALRVTSQTIYNLQKGQVSDQLLEHAFLVLDKWEEKK